MDKVISRQIATGIIHSVLCCAERWNHILNDQGDILSRGRLRILVEAREIHVLTEIDEWVLLDLNERDIERVQDVAYDMVHDRQWAKSKADPIKIAIDEIGISFDH